MFSLLRKAFERAIASAPPSLAARAERLLRICDRANAAMERASRKIGLDPDDRPAFGKNPDGRDETIGQRRDRLARQAQAREFAEQFNRVGIQAFSEAHRAAFVEYAVACEYDEAAKPEAAARFRATLREAYHLPPVSDVKPTPVRVVRGPSFTIDRSRS